VEQKPCIYYSKTQRLKDVLGESYVNAGKPGNHHAVRCDSTIPLPIADLGDCRVLFGNENCKPLIISNQKSAFRN
jgi:hypothetical protein